MEHEYNIYIDYGEEINSRKFFESVSSFVISIDNLNNALAHWFGSDIETEIFITKIEGGSIKVWMRDTLKKLPDDKIRDYTKNPMAMLGDFLVVAKYKIIEHTNKTPESFNEKVVEIIENEIKKLPELEAYGYQPNKIETLKAVGNLSRSAKMLPKPPVFQTGTNELPVSSDYEFNIEEIEDIIKQTQTTRQTFIIKKPDMIGDSKWSIIFGKSIDVSIRDQEFKDKIKNRELSISHGDMLDAELIIETYLDNHMKVVETNYTIDKVYDIIPPNTNLQGDLFT